MDLSTLTLIINIVVLPIVGIAGFMVRRMAVKVENTMTKQEIRQTIDDKMEPVRVMLKVIDKRLDLIEKEQHLIFLEVKKNGQEKR